MSMKDFVDFFAQCRILFTDSLTILRGFMDQNEWFWVTCWVIISVGTFLTVNSIFLWKYLGL